MLYPIHHQSIAENATKLAAGSFNYVEQKFGIDDIRAYGFAFQESISGRHARLVWGVDTHPYREIHGYDHSNSFDIWDVDNFPLNSHTDIPELGFMQDECNRLIRAVSSKADVDSYDTIQSDVAQTLLEALTVVRDLYPAIPFFLTVDYAGGMVALLDDHTCRRVERTEIYEI